MRAQPGRADRSVPGVARKSEDGLTMVAQNIVRENITSHALSDKDGDCGIYDIVKRRLIRVWDPRSNSRIPITISGTFRRSLIAR